MKEKTDQVPLKAAAWRTSVSIRLVKWMLVGPVLALFLLGHGFGAEWAVPSGQPEQMWSEVDYDPKLSDPFFESNEWSYPWYIIKHPDGHFESTRSEDESPVKDPPRLKHTAKCFFTSLGSKHLVRFCEARLHDVNMIDLLIHESNPSFIDSLRLQIRNRMFTSQYWTAFKIRPRIPPGATWTTNRQELTLDRKVYQKGDVIRGRIDLECVQEITDPKLVEHYHRNPTTVKAYGVFKTVIE